MKTKTLKTLGLSLFFALCSTTLPAAENTTKTDASATVPTTTATESASAQTQNPNTVNINNASAAEIQDKLIGIGAKKAQAIVDYRTQNSTFANIEQLTEVSGIGAAILDKNRDRITLQ